MNVFFAALVAANFAWPSYMDICNEVQEYLKTHSKAEAYAEAARRNVPRWMIRRAEKCMPPIKGKDEGK
jgi:hypothetical protein